MKQQEEWEENYKKETIKRALSVDLPDGIYIIFYFNRYQTRGKGDIDFYQVFQSESHETIQEWIEKCEKLLSTNWDVGNASVNMAHAYKKRGMIQTFFFYLFERNFVQEYEKAKKEFIKNNPGFREKTYENAIQDGASYACH